MERRPLHHLLYTNAPGRDGDGFRVAHRSAGWSREGVGTVAAWVQGLRNAAARGPGFAAAAFRVDGELYACLARVDGEFARDTHGRTGGTLAHVLAVAVEEERDVCLHAMGLVAAALRLQRPELPDRQRLEAYRRSLQDLQQVELRPPNLEALEVLGETALPPLLASAAAGLPPSTPALPPPTVDLVPPPSRALAEVLAVATGALPPRLRLAFRWACGLAEAPELHLLARRGAGGRGEPGNAAVYHRWLVDHLAAGRRHRLRPVLADWRIRSWPDLLRAAGLPANAGPGRSP